MAKEKPIEVITPPNLLKAKVGGKLAPLDEKAIARAEAALKGLSAQFDDWMVEELTKLEAAHEASRAAGHDEKEVTVLFRCAHDIKGLGETYEYPLVSRLAKSLCTLIENEPARAKAHAGLVRAHVDAIKAAVRQQIRTSDHPVGAALLTELETNVAAVAA